MFFIFYTRRQLDDWEGIGVVFFRPLWPRMCSELRKRFEAIVADGMLRRTLEQLAQWKVQPPEEEVQVWRDALQALEKKVGSFPSGKEGDALRLAFLQRAIRVYKPMWDAVAAGGGAVGEAKLDPRSHPFSASRHLLDHLSRAQRCVEQAKPIVDDDRYKERHHDWSS